MILLQPSKAKPFSSSRRLCADSESTAISQMLNLPIIDIAPYLSDRPVDIALRKATSEALHSACLEFGFFYLTISEFVDPAVPEELTTLAREFFSLPQAEKDKLSLSNQDNARGSSALNLKHVVIARLDHNHPGYARLKENVTNGKVRVAKS